jgi:methanogenic corrinoid protein MtbC1
MYTIAEAARRAGVSVPVLRAWERRYGIVRPGRTEAGYRLYDDAAIDRVRAMRHLVSEGWSPRNAATWIATEGVPASVADRSRDQFPVERSPGDDALVGAFVDAAGRLDQAELTGILDEMFARGSFETIVQRLLMPALVSLGEAWANGSLPVAAEHAASAAVHRRLAAAFEAAGSSASAPVVLVGLPAGSWHELGALAFATVARRAGLSVLYLGPDLPPDDWVQAVVRTNPADPPRAAVLGIVMKRDRGAADRVVEALRAACPELVVAVGGASAVEADGVIRLPSSIPEAVSALEAALETAAAMTR